MFCSAETTWRDANCGCSQAHDSPEKMTPEAKSTHPKTIVQTGFSSTISKKEKPRHHTHNKRGSKGERGEGQSKQTREERTNKQKRTRKKIYQKEIGAHLLLFSIFHRRGEMVRPALTRRYSWLMRQRKSKTVVLFRRTSPLGKPKAAVSNILTRENDDNNNNLFLEKYETPNVFGLFFCKL